MYLKEKISDTISKNYKISIATTQDEVFQAQKIRYEYLRKEYNKDLNCNECLDLDEYDEYCSHLIVSYDNPNTNQWEVVGSYRVTRWEHIKDNKKAFISEGEFCIDKIKEEYKDEIVELSRAVIAPEHRNGVVIFLLWEGIMRYCAQYNCRYIIGTASFHGNDIEACQKGLSYLIQSSMIDEKYKVFAHKNKGSNFNLLPLDSIDKSTADEQIPSLIKSYGKMNAQFAKDIFVDEWFNSIDVFVFIDKYNIPERYTKKMQLI